MVSFLLNIGPFTVDSTDSSGSTPLMDAIKSDHVEVAETLISTQKVWNHVKLELKIAVQLNYILKIYAD